MDYVVSLHLLTSFWVFSKSVDLHVPTYICEFFYSKGMLMQKKLVNAIFFCFLFLCRHGKEYLHGALGNRCKCNKQTFVIFSNAGIGK
jgi:hypothetical protein